MGTNESYQKRLAGGLQGAQCGAHVMGYAPEPLHDAQPLLHLYGIIKNKGRSPRVLRVVPLELGSTLGLPTTAQWSHDVWWV